jgi:hypothetical protein
VPWYGSEIDEATFTAQWARKLEMDSDAPARDLAESFALEAILHNLHQALRADVKHHRNVASNFDKITRKIDSPFTGHSFKKGAAAVIVAAAARGECDISLLPRLLKHKTAADLVSVSIRYVPTESRVALAQALRTQEATKRL